MIYELFPQYDKRKSFYHKAFVVVEDGVKMLFSYETLVASIHDKQVTLLDEALYSMTTLRHTKEFLKQNGFKAETKNQIIRDYMKG